MPLLKFADRNVIREDVEYHAEVLMPLTTTGPEMFRRVWRGYDCAQVNAFVQQAAVDRVRLREALARVDTLLTRYARSGPYVIVAAAQHEAQEIRARAQAEAERILQEANARLETVQPERAALTPRAQGARSGARVATHTRLVLCAIGANYASFLVSGVPAPDMTARAQP